MIKTIDLTCHAWVFEVQKERLQNLNTIFAQDVVECLKLSHRRMQSGVEVTEVGKFLTRFHIHFHFEKKIHNFAENYLINRTLNLPTEVRLYFPNLHMKLTLKIELHFQLKLWQFMDQFRLPTF